MPTPQSSSSAHATRDFEAPLFALPLRSGPGRRSLCTPEVVEKICAFIRIDGISDSAAGYLAGVTSSSLSRWKLDYEEVDLALGQARAEFEERCIRKISNARKRDGTEDWRAVAWLLRHSSPEGFGPKSRRRKEAEAPEGFAPGEDGGDDQAAARDAEIEAMNVRLVAAFTKRQASAPEPTDEELAAEVENLPEIKPPSWESQAAAGGETVRTVAASAAAVNKHRPSTGSGPTAILPEIHQAAGAGHIRPLTKATLERAFRNLEAAPSAQSSPDSPRPAKLSRHERRALERQQAKAAKVAKQQVKQPAMG